VNRIINFLIRLKILKKDGIHMLELLNGEPWQRWVPIPIRIILGVGFMVHGWAKWSRGPAAFAELLRQAHVPLPLANAWLVTLLEIFGGLALLMGAFVAIVSVPLILSMLGAMFTVNIKFGFSAVNTIGLTAAGPQLGPPGYEINLLYIACLVVLILGGAGPLSIDALRSHRRPRDSRVALQQKEKKMGLSWQQPVERSVL
jgi:putative oxidoreductase